MLIEGSNAALSFLLLSAARVFADVSATAVVDRQVYIELGEHYRLRRARFSLCEQPSPARNENSPTQYNENRHEAAKPAFEKQTRHEAANALTHAIDTRLPIVVQQTMAIHSSAFPARRQPTDIRLRERFSSSASAWPVRRQHCHARRSMQSTNPGARSHAGFVAWTTSLHFGNVRAAALPPLSIIPRFGTYQHAPNPQAARSIHFPSQNAHFGKDLANLSVHSGVLEQRDELP